MRCYVPQTATNRHGISFKTLTGSYSGTVVLNYWICLLGPISLREDKVTVGVSHQVQQ